MSRAHGPALQVTLPVRMPTAWRGLGVDKLGFWQVIATRWTAWGGPSTSAQPCKCEQSCLRPAAPAPVLGPCQEGAAMLYGSCQSAHPCLLPWPPIHTINPLRTGVCVRWLFPQAQKQSGRARERLPCMAVHLPVRVRPQISGPRPGKGGEHVLCPAGERSPRKSQASLWGVVGPRDGEGAMGGSSSEPVNGQGPRRPLSASCRATAPPAAVTVLGGEQSSLTLAEQYLGPR